MSIPPLSKAQEIRRLEDEALTQLQNGREAASIGTWKKLLQLHPGHVQALTLVGQYAFRQTDFAAARSAFERAAAADGRDPRQWTSIAFACQRLGDDDGEERALERAARVAPRDLLMLLLRGDLHERKGRQAAAASCYGTALSVAPPPDRLPPELRPRLMHAAEYRRRHLDQLGERLDAELAETYRECDGDAARRFRLSLDLMLGRRPRYESQPLQYFFPGLPAIEFFDRQHFPWIEEVEACTDDIRSELLGLLESEEGFSPYVSYPDDQPLDQWAALNNSRDWSAFHLVKTGDIVDENASRCPRTMQAWRRVPAPDQPGRTPNLMFSALRPRTRIPPHVGSSNARLVVHLPLIVPPGCGFRVGNTVREWREGSIWVFDDTIEHEAWNDSDQRRVILIFDAWHPMLSPEERRLISALGRGLNRLQALDAGADAL